MVQVVIKNFVSANFLCFILLGEQLWTLGFCTLSWFSFVFNGAENCKDTPIKVLKIMAIFSWFYSLFKPKVGLQSGMAKSREEKKKKMRVVVIGGGVGGSIVAYSLQSVADVVLIDQ